MLLDKRRLLALYLRARLFNNKLLTIDNMMGGNFARFFAFFQKCELVLEDGLTWSGDGNQAGSKAAGLAKESKFCRKKNELVARPTN
ncbi:hypothetical protein KUV22_00585 [Microbulbifer agarilyticus]|uniref:hypothetical protein n=1 Tax=Microbulbifer agarilyticus TaxID=260552 RepID=UPI001C9674CD|nr:hypothetical protein [Microbulbifer agarilyticus]MBY6188915.1 hypothetical protein [Microbulbifer agarilyticus]